MHMNPDKVFDNKSKGTWKSQQSRKKSLYNKAVKQIKHTIKQS